MLPFGNTCTPKLDTTFPFDDAEGMDARPHMLALTAAAALAVGCGPPAIRPSKSISVPAGEKPVLTSVERTVQPMLERTPPDPERSPAEPVAQATFKLPLAEPEPIRPISAWTEQEVAAEALGRIGVAAVPALVETLQSPDPAVRLKGVEVLGRMGAEARDAVPELVRLLDDPDPAVRKAATRTLGRIGPAAHEAVPALMKSLLQPPAPLHP